ncbi:anmK, partial [Symbiodinium sp. KB8]
ASAAAIAAAAQHLPTVPRVWLVTGGGRHNATLLARVAARLPEGTAVAPVDTVGWDGDAMEAAAFGFLAVRSLRGLHLTEPGTTGCREACTGGVTHLPPEEGVGEAGASLGGASNTAGMAWLAAAITALSLPWLASLLLALQWPGDNTCPMTYSQPGFSRVWMNGSVGVDSAVWPTGAVQRQLGHRWALLRYSCPRQ